MVYLDRRVQVIHDYNDGCCIAELAQTYEDSRKTIYKWLGRHSAEGFAALAGRSRTPLYRPTQVSEQIVALIVAARQRWRWEPCKLRAKLTAEYQKLHRAAESAIGEVLKRAGLTNPRKPRGAGRGMEKCYPCPRIEVLPMCQVGQMRCRAAHGSKRLLVFFSNG